MHVKRIAVVGGGVAGLSAAWLLSKRFEVTLFEANNYVGGHSNTVNVPGRDGQPMPVDTGFIVYNERNYPNLTGLFGHLGVATAESDMSFSFTAEDASLEWAGDNINTLFAQRRNLFNPGFLRMMLDILKFNRQGKRFLQQAASPELAGDAAGSQPPGPGHDMALGEFLDQIGVGANIRKHYLLPMAAAIWSCPPREMLHFPARRFLQFFHNHGLIDLANRPQWRSVVNGSREYVQRMLPGINGGHHVSSPVRQIRRLDDGVHLYGSDGIMGRFDEVVIAAHADQALAMLEQPSPLEQSLLSGIRYQANDAWLHTDADLMPRLRRVWASWNYLGSPDERPASVSYWMNRLQHLPTEQDWFVTLNPIRPPRVDTVHRRIAYDHPVFDQAAMAAQAGLGQIQGKDRLWFCGSYFGYGFHEDALRSSVDLARAMGIEAPWNQLPGRAGEQPVPAAAANRSADNRPESWQTS